MPPPVQRPSPDAGDALVVEESIVIALEMETLLQEAGIGTCALVSTTDDALSILAARPVGFAIIDIHVGLEAAEEIAHALQERVLPFVFSARYGEAGPLRTRFPDVPVLAKPLRATDLYRALERIGALQGPGSTISQ